MTKLTLGRSLLVALALVGLAFAIPVVSAHGEEATPGGQHPYDGDADSWVDWMGAHMNPGAVVWMESHAGVTSDEMARDVAVGSHWSEDGHDHGTNGYDHGTNGYDHGTNGYDHGTNGYDRGTHGHDSAC